MLCYDGADGDQEVDGDDVGDALCDDRGADFPVSSLENGLQYTLFFFYFRV